MCLSDKFHDAFGLLPRHITTQFKADSQFLHNTWCGKKKQVALLSQRGCAMLRVCQ